MRAHPGQRTLSESTLHNRSQNTPSFQLPIPISFTDSTASFGPSSALKSQRYIERNISNGTSFLVAPRASATICNSILDLWHPHPQYHESYAVWVLTS